jgi:hypothetical protein
MKHALLLVVGTLLTISIASAAENFAGEYADKNYLHGKSVFQLSVEQGGNDVGLFFSAANNDGSGAGPEGQGRGKVTSKGTVEFKWSDSFKNSGTGTITKSGTDVIISLTPTHVADSRCLSFYSTNIHLKPAGKK